MVFNTFLIFAQYRCKSWTKYEQILTFQLTITNIVGCLYDISSTIARIFIKITTGSYDVPAGRWIVIPQNAFELATILTLKMLAMDCCTALKRFYKRGNSARNHKKAAVQIVIVIWIIASIVAILGLTHSSAGVLNGWIPTRVGAYLCLMLLLGSIFWDFRKAQKLGAILEADFTHRQAQQRLESRLHLRNAESFTRTMFPILILHLVLGFTGWTIDFVVDVIVLPNLQSDESYFQFADDVVGVVLDTVSSNIFGLVYPVLYVWYHKKTRQIILSWIRKTQSQPQQIFFTQSSSRDSVRIAGPEMVGSSGLKHFRTLEETWQHAYEKNPGKRYTPAPS